MAEIVLSAFLDVLFEKLASAALKNIARHKGLDAEIKKWQRSLKQIQRMLADASRKEITDTSVKEWLKDLQHLAYDIDDVLDGWLTEAMQSESTHDSEGATSKVRKLIPTCCTSFSRSTAMLDELDDISTKLQDLVKEKDTLGLSVTEETRPRNNNRRFQSSVFDPSSIVGRQAEKDALVQQLLLPANEPCRQNYSIVPIVGMGGVGKTTLARLLYSDKQVKDHFGLKAWVCVSDEFDSFAISKVIFQSVVGVNKEFADLNLLQEDLVNHLRGKRFLLVLDDVWTESYEDWKALVCPFHACASGSKIIITTRKEQLLKRLGYGHLKQLQILSHDDALSLFALHVLGVDSFDSHLSLKSYGEAIVKKCDGLPLALITLGTSLRTKEDEASWNKVLESEIWTLPVQGEIIPALKLSYHDLSAPLKRLFLYCSLFPKDFLFDKEEVVLLWVAEGFLHHPTPSNSTEESLGHEYFDELLSRSFFQHAPNKKSLFVMHDLMHDLATSVATEFYLRLDNESEKNIRMDMFEKYRHMAFVREKYVAYKKFEAFTKAKNLRTFLATSVGEIESWPDFYLSNKILTDLLPALPLLRVLSLRGFKISEVPPSIGTLTHLRYLNLSQTRITYLPETVCNLYNLQALILFCCYELTKLPNSFLKLKNLRQLDIRDTPLLFQTLLGIAKLKGLQISLSKISIESENRFEIAQLKDFKNLCGKISIVGLEKIQNALYAHEVNFSQKRLSELELVWSDALHDSRNEMLEKEVLNELKPHNEYLEELKIRSYGGLEFPKWVGDPMFLHLKYVSISDCNRCTSLPPLTQLPALKELFIKGLHGVEVVGFELSKAGSTFPSLEILRFEAMHGWKKWSGGVLQYLQNLTIKDCPNLVEVTFEALPTLNVLDIDGCDNCVLRRLVEIASAVKILDIGDISGLNDVVWRGVIEYLGAVEELWLTRCNEIRYLVKSDASKVLENLRNLKLLDCDNLVSLGEKEEDNCRSNLLTSLRILNIYNCENMERCICPYGIEELFVSDCSSIIVVSFPKGGLEKLRSLQIYYCKKLLERGWEGQKLNNNRSIMPMLEYASISNWPNLKSIVQLNCLVHLTTLRISNCKSLESFPDNLTSLKDLDIRYCPKLVGSFLCDNLTSLEKLGIVNCPSVDASFPGWVWPPRLSFLAIGKLKKPISEWGLQKFPTSLVELQLYGYGKDGVSSSSSYSSQFSHLLPPSLTSLRIHAFEKLESFSTGLQHLQHLSFFSCHNLKKVWHPQHLTSLHRLSFEDCPNMIVLPEMLFPSLLSLRIGYNCPNLKERCNKNGSYWPVISHIPCIIISN